MEKKPWTTIYFFDGGEVQWRAVLTEDLPRLAGATTFWRESMTDEERAKKLKARIADVMPTQATK